MASQLKLHADSRSRAVTGIAAEVTRGPDGLELRYVIAGVTGDLILPAPTEPRRADELWKHTCFEVFVRPERGEAYCEFNFSPSTQWAAYRFTGQRSGMGNLEEADAPHIEVSSARDRLEVRVSLTLDRVLMLPKQASWRIAISAVIEEAGGTRSYWALAHPQGKPDFHHPDSFVLDLPVPEQR